LKTSGGLLSRLIDRHLYTTKRFHRVIHQLEPSRQTLQPADAARERDSFGLKSFRLSLRCARVRRMLLHHLKDGSKRVVADVSARVAWSGVGVNLATNAPTAAALLPAVRAVLDDPKFRAQAALNAEEARGIDTRSEILGILGQQVQTSRAVGSQARKVAAQR
jgi:hypothetical protein